MNAKDNLSIKDFSRLSGIKETTLRYWDQLGLFTPVWRSEGGFRYYSVEQLITSNAIKLAENLGVSTKELIQLVHERTPEMILDIFNEKAAALKQQLTDLERTYDVVQTFRRVLSLGIYAPEQKLSVRFHEDIALKFGPRNDWSKMDEGDFFGPLIAFYEASAENTLDVRFPIGGYWSDWQAFMRAPNQPERFFSIDPRGDRRRTSGLYLTSYTHGYYGTTEGIEETMNQYLTDKQLTPTGPVYCAYVLDEVSVRDKNDFLLQTSVGIRKPGEATF